MAVNIKFTKFDNTPWGFRLAGGSDFPHPLTVIRVTEGSLAECMGLKVGDIVVRLNDQPIGSLTHGQAHEELMRAGNNFVLGVQREEDPLKAVEALSEENIVPYKIPLADLPPVFPEKILTEIVIEEREEIRIEEKVYEEEAKPEVEPLPEKPQDANSEVVPNQNLTDDEIAQLILEEEELLTDKGVLGVNFKKLRPRATVLRQSKVIEELQNLATAEPPLVEQLKRTSVFLKKPERPVPVPRKKQEEQQETEVESYKVVIKKQQKRSITDRLLEKGLLKPEDAPKTPEPPTPEVNMESNELGMKIEEDDSSIVSSELVDDYSSSEPIVAPFEFSSACVRPDIEIPSIPSSLDLEPETRTDSESDILPLQSSRLEEVVASSRRQTNKRKFKRFYTKAHYFRRCLFGKRGHGEVKMSKPRSPIGERSRDNAKACTLLAEQLQERPRRCSLETSRIKGRYLETYLKREDNWMRRVVDGLFDEPNLDNFLSSKLFGRAVSGKRISPRRTRYAEKILLRSVEFVAVRLRSDVERYLEQGGSTKVLDPSSYGSRIGKRLYFKGRYFQRIFWRNVARLISYLGVGTSPKEARGRDRRRSSMIKMRGRYLERYLESALLDLEEFGDRRSRVVSSKRRLFGRARYVERILKKHLESLALIVEHVYQSISGTSVVIPGCSALNVGQEPSVTSVAKDDDDALSCLLRSSKDFISTEVFHRGSRRLSRSCRGSVSGSVNVSGVLKNYLFDFNWFSRQSMDLATNEKKIAPDNDREGRRLSFVPTILYEGLTNRIGVDFTRLVAYAFVPCTSIILLYMYK